MKKEDIIRAFENGIKDSFLLSSYECEDFNPKKDFKYAVEVRGSEFIILKSKEVCESELAKKVIYIIDSEEKSEVVNVKGHKCYEKFLLLGKFFGYPPSSVFEFSKVEVNESFDEEKLSIFIKWNDVLGFKTFKKTIFKDIFYLLKNKNYGIFKNSISISFSKDSYEREFKIRL